MHQSMPVNEADRLAALALYEVVDTPPEFAHDALTELAAQICNCPVALLQKHLGCKRLGAGRRVSFIAKLTAASGTGKIASAQARLLTTRAR